MGVVGWSLAFLGLGAGASVAFFIFEGIIPTLLLTAVALVALWRANAANDKQSAAREATTLAALGSPPLGATWLSGQELTDRTSFDRATQEGSAP